MKFKLISSILAVILLTAALAGSVTAHYFSPCKVDTKTFTKGKLDLRLSKKIQRQYYSCLRFEIVEENVAPSFTKTYEYKLDNKGNIHGKLNLASIKVVNEELDITDPEKKLGDTKRTGELGDRLILTLSYKSAGGKERVIYNGTFNSFNSTSLKQKNEVLNAGKSVEFIIKVEWPATDNNDADNLAQSDRLKLYYNLGMTQKK